MQKIIDDYRLMTEVARLHYEENLSQKEVAEALDLSRPSVSRLINRARELGIIKIKIDTSFSSPFFERAQRIKQNYGLKKVLITENNEDREVLEENIALLGSGFLGSILKGEEKVGLDSGRLVLKTVEKLKLPEETLVYALSGSDRVFKPKERASFIAEKLAGRSNCKLIYSSLPARIESPELKEELLRETGLLELYSGKERADIILLEPEKRSDSFGLLGQSFDEFGLSREFKEENKKALSAGLNTLKKVPTSILLSTCRDDPKAVRAALLGGYVNVLITDEATAKTL